MVRTGAVIAAAGMSSRMGDFKPMLNIGTMSMAERIIHNLILAGVCPIVVITGYRAEELENHLSKFDVVCIRNEKYKNSEMSDSAKLGFSYIMERCDRTFFTPVDIPLFSVETLKSMMAVQAEVVKPVCRGEEGHPILLSSQLIRRLCQNKCESGLRDAIMEDCKEIELLTVSDEGILYDADTPAQYQYLRSKVSQNPGIPTDEDIEGLWDVCGTAAHIREHCIAVSRVCMQYYEKLEDIGIVLSREKLRAAALLHDTCRAEGKKHVTSVCQLLNERGYLDIAAIIETHHDISFNGKINERSILYLADKMVDGSVAVELEERFQKSRCKCTTKEAVKKHEERYQNALHIKMAVNQLLLSDSLRSL